MLMSLLTAAALFAISIMGNALRAHTLLVYLLLAIPICGINCIAAVLSAYSSEIFPTRIRARGTGFAAGVSKAAGVIIIALVAIGVAPPSITATTLIGAVPIALAPVAFVFLGVETRNSRLEEITALELAQGAAGEGAPSP